MICVGRQIIQKSDMIYDHVSGGIFGGEMEFMKLSKFKLQLRALISEVKDLREREQSTAAQLQLSIQKQKQSEEQLGKKLKELETELASSNESRQRLERKVNYLQNDNALLEIKQKELNATVQSLLQSREQFVNAYQESTYDMKRSIEARDRKLKILSEKLKSHLLLFDSIEKEALSVKQVVDNVQHVVNEKEEAVIGLKRKFDRLSEVEKIFIEKMREMEKRLGKYRDELQRKATHISELEAKLDTERINNKSQTQVELLQKELSKKEAVIQNLISEKQSLDSELKSLGAVLERIQHAFRVMNEDKEAFLSIAKNAGKCCTLPREEMKRIADPEVETRRDPESQPALEDFAVCTERHETKEQEFHSAEASRSLAYGIKMHNIVLCIFLLSYGNICNNVVCRYSPLALQHSQSVLDLNQLLLLKPSSVTMQRWNLSVQPLKQKLQKILA